MKKDIHPVYHSNAKVTCSCGNSFEVGSTNSEIRVEICSACHPFFTGKQKYIDTAGRIDRFKAKLQAKASLAKKPTAKVDKAETKDEKEISNNQSTTGLKDLNKNIDTEKKLKITTATKSKKKDSK